MTIINIKEQIEVSTSVNNVSDIPLIISTFNKSEKSVAEGDKKVNDIFPREYTNLSSFELDIPTCPSTSVEELTVYDTAYIMAVELLNAGMPVYYAYLEDIISEKHGKEVRSFITDKNEMTIKFMCIPDMNTLIFGNDTNSKPLNIKKTILEMCANRGDCTFLIDCERAFDYTTITAVQDALSLEKTGDVMEPNNAYAAAFVPWYNYNLTKGYVEKKNDPRVRKAALPGSYAYLRTLVENIRTTNNWLAMAGISRGAVPGILTPIVANNRKITNTVANTLQPMETTDLTFAVNAITEIKPYGPVIWGNRTIQAIEKDKVLSASHFLNIRNMISDIKKRVYDVCKTLMFDQMDEILWLNFLSGVTPYLDRLKSGAGISEYKLIKKPTDKSAKATLEAEIIIYPLNAVEAFTITIVAAESEVKTEE